MEKRDQGFASMPMAKRVEIARRGGRAAHARGTARQWTPEEAREAGRKGGLERARRAAEQTAREGEA